MNFAEYNKSARLTAMICLCAAMYTLIASGRITIFLHPRSVFIVKIAWVIILGMTLNDFRTFFSRHTQVRFDWRTVVWFLPLAIGLMVHPTGLSSQVAMQKGVSSLSISSQKHSSSGKSGQSIVPGLTRGAIDDTLHDNTMYITLDSIYHNRELFDGSRITMTGFIAPDTMFGRHSFFLTRMMVACCAADAMPIGFYCIADSRMGLLENDWAQLTGRVEIRSLKIPGQDQTDTIPVLRIIGAQKVKPPQQQYVYPVAF